MDLWELFAEKRYALRWLPSISSKHYNHGPHPQPRFDEDLSPAL